MQTRQDLKDIALFKRFSVCLNQLECCCFVFLPSHYGILSWMLHPFVGQTMKNVGPHITLDIPEGTKGRSVCGSMTEIRYSCMTCDGRTKSEALSISFHDKSVYEFLHFRSCLQQQFSKEWGALYLQQVYRGVPADTFFSYSRGRPLLSLKLHQILIIDTGETYRYNIR